MGTCTLCRTQRADTSICADVSRETLERTSTVPGDHDDRRVVQRDGTGLRGRVSDVSRETVGAHGLLGIPAKHCHGGGRGLRDTGPVRAETLDSHAFDTEA